MTASGKKKKASPNNRFSTHGEACFGPPNREPAGVPGAFASSSLREVSVLAGSHSPGGVAVSSGAFDALDADITGFPGRNLNGFGGVRFAVGFPEDFRECLAVVGELDRVFLSGGLFPFQNQFADGFFAAEIQLDPFIVRSRGSPAGLVIAVHRVGGGHAALFGTGGRLCSERQIAGRRIDHDFPEGVAELRSAFSAENPDVAGFLRFNLEDFAGAPFTVGDGVDIGKVLPVHGELHDIVLSGGGLPVQTDHADRFRCSEIQQKPFVVRAFGCPARVAFSIRRVTGNQSGRFPGARGRLCTECQIFHLFSGDSPGDGKSRRTEYQHCLFHLIFFSGCFDPCFVAENYSKNYYFFKLFDRISYFGSLAAFTGKEEKNAFFAIFWGIDSNFRKYGVSFPRIVENFLRGRNVQLC